MAESQRFKKLIILAALLVGISACQEQHLQDIDTETRWGEFSVELEENQISIQAMDQIDVYQNLNEYPNLVRVCIDGVAFLVVSGKWWSGQGFESKPYERIPEWDDHCMLNRRMPQEDALR